VVGIHTSAISVAFLSLQSTIFQVYTLVFTPTATTIAHRATLLFVTFLVFINDAREAMLLLYSFTHDSFHLVMLLAAFPPRQPSLLPLG